MSEMSAEKKKEIEKYIIKSYFGGGKNVESLANGADVVKGTDDGCIPQLIVEVTYFGESGVVMIKWNIYGDSQQNSFAMRVCREREIERNRCDSVDAMAYAWESWRAKIQGKPIFIGKDKKRIEFSMRSMMVTHKPHEDHSDISITGMIPDREIFAANNPFDIPCDVVMVSKRDFERLQTRADNEVELAKQWEINYNLLLKKTGFDTVEELVNYLNSDAECGTLHEAISKLKDQVKYTCDEWYSANSRNNSWKAAAECNSPKELIEKLNVLRDDISGHDAVIESYELNIKKWQKATGCPSPSAAKNLINGLEKAVRLTDTTMLNELESNIDEWQKATGRISPEEAKQYIDRLKDRLNKIHDCSVVW